MPTEDDGWKYAEKNTKFDRLQVATGVIQHLVTKCWQTWISLYGHDVACIYASKQKNQAEATRQSFAKEWQEGQLTTIEEVIAFLEDVKTFPGELIEPLPRWALEELRSDVNSMVKPKGFGT